MICNTITNRDICFVLFWTTPGGAQELLLAMLEVGTIWEPGWNWIPACNASTLLIVLLLWPPLIVLGIQHFKTTNSTHMFTSLHHYFRELPYAPHISTYPMLNSSTINSCFCCLRFIISLIWKKNHSLSVLLLTSLRYISQVILYMLIRNSFQDFKICVLCKYKCVCRRERENGG